MGVVFIVSPNYLGSIFEEAKRYSFGMQGYGNLESATKGLTRVNAADVLGFACVYSNIGNEELNSLFEFLQKCDYYGSKKFLIIVKNSISINKVEDICKNLKNLRVSIVQNTEYISDSIINRNVFGSILLDNFEPYKLSKESVQQTKIVSEPYALKPLISKNMLRVLHRVFKLSSIEHTLEMDEVYNYFIQHNKVLATIRKLIIYKEFNKNVIKDLQDLKISIEKSPNEFCLEYLTLIDLVRTGEYKEAQYQDDR